MPYSVPSYVIDAGKDNSRLLFKWDDWKSSEDSEYSEQLSDRVVKSLAPVTLRAKIAAAIGIYEWIIWRFRSLVEDPAPFQIAEAAWCANVDRNYMEYVEFDHKKWLGPIRGPLWTAMTWLIPMVFFSYGDPVKWESGLSRLNKIAVLVLPNRAPFEDWLNKSIDRLLRLYPAPPDDPFENLFGENEEEQRGPLVPSEVLDPYFIFNPDQARTLIEGFLKRVDYRSNPYLKTPDTLLKEGFAGIPYQLSRDQ